MQINNEMNLLCSDDNLITGFSYKKYNITMVKLSLKIEIKKCSLADITVYECICSDDIGVKNYQDQIDLRHFFSPDRDGKINFQNNWRFYFGKF